MANVKLGKDQTISIDGVPLEGVRDVTFELDLKTTEVTSWEHQFASTLITAVDGTINLVIYWADSYDVILPKLFEHTPVPIRVDVSNCGYIYCLPVSVRIVQPIDGVLAWNVTLRMHSYNAP